MGRKAAANKQQSRVEQAVAASSAPSSPVGTNANLAQRESTTVTQQPAASSHERDKAPKVNTSSLADLKNTCDDVVKEVFARPGAFTRSHAHEDVRLGLGWSAVAVAAATAYYSFVTEFHDSKRWTAVGVACYAVLSTVLTLYVMFVEQDVIFDGKRKTFAARASSTASPPESGNGVLTKDEQITTERLILSSQAHASEKSAKRRSPFPLSLVSRGPPPADLPASLTYPAYHLTISYNHSSNNGKALIHQATIEWSRCFGEFFDEQGTLAKPKLEQELQQVLDQVMKTT
ncbi:hypothetical protein OIO90_002493 [Microbotryomycetes sp. JL221]|nr:hypothetical protein OIO90_002493 [Microbotryomycetes sp. JL221]